MRRTPLRAVEVPGVGHQFPGTHALTRGAVGIIQVRQTKEMTGLVSDDADATYSSFVCNRQVWEEQRPVMGPDPWKFGNENVLNTIIRYAGEQGLLANKMTIRDLFIQIDEANSRSLQILNPRPFAGW